MTQELIKRLYDLARGPSTYWEAAAALEAKDAEIERLKSLNDLAVKQAETLVKQRDAALAEVERLKRDCDIANLGFDTNSKTIVALAAKLAAMEAVEPIFYYRPTCNGEMYEGPHHAKSIGGRMLREEKPTEWVALYAAPKVAQPLTVEAYTAIAHRTASKYAHRSDPAHVVYTFFPHTLDDFVRKIEAAIGGQQP